jgi:hypothetical protein
MIDSDRLVTVNHCQCDRLVLCFNQKFWTQGPLKFELSEAAFSKEDKVLEFLAKCENFDPVPGRMQLLPSSMPTIAN